MFTRQLLRRFSTISKQEIPSLAKSIHLGDRLALSRTITLLESSLPSDQELTSELFRQLSTKYEPKQTIRLGLSGAPGVGKSTLIERFGMYLVKEEKMRLAVLTVDPSSVRSGGSILGDKTRMPSLSAELNAFIRSSPNRGDPGGVIVSTFDTIRLCEYANYDVVIVETVGVGQSEFAVLDLVDIFVLLVAPGIGDELQGLKKGITEMADIILVNKADDPMDKDANQTLFEYRSAMKYVLGGRPKKVLPISGRTGRGIPEAWSTIQEFIGTIPVLKSRRKEQEARWLSNITQQELIATFHDYIKNIKEVERLSINDGSLRASAQLLLTNYLEHIARAKFGGNR